MQTTNTFSDTFEERMNILDATNRYKLDIQYTQQVFQPIRETYEPNQQIRVVLQRSNHVIRVSDIGIMFRPVIKYAKDSLPDVSRKSFLCITPTCASDFFQMVVLTTNGNSLLSQSGCPASSNRAQMMNFYNSLRPIQGNKLGAEDSFDAGVTFPSSSLNTLVGCEENSISHPYQAVTNGLIPTYASNYSYADGDQFARAIISKAYAYNLEHNIPPSDQTQQPGSAYFAGYWNPQMLPLQNANSGFTPIVNGGAGGNQDPAGVTYNINLPCLPLCITPSISQYHLCNSRFQSLRMRFITATTSFFSFAGTQALSPSTLLAQSTSVTNNMNNNGNAVPANYADAPQRMCYGSSIQGIYDHGSTLLYGGGNSVARQLGTLPTAANCTYYPTENYTNLVCRLGAVSMELEEIGDIEFSQTQLVAILQLNPPEQVLSAYLQPGCMFIDKAIASLGTKNYITGADGVPIGGCRPGPTSAECYQFLQSCLIGSATYQVTDLCARIPYKTFPIETQGIVREICYAPRPFRSMRVQSDIINNPNSIQTQRISIGGSSICLGVITFIKPVFPSLTSDLVIRSQDTMVCYQGCNVPSLGDLRYVPQLDSCYLPSVQFSLQVDNNIYDANPIIPISSPQYSTYLKSLDGIPLIFDGKQTPINLRDFVTNRYFMAIGINSRALQQAAIVDQQIIVSASFDASERINIAKAMGTVRQNCNACFMMTSYVITMQSLVNDDYVKI